jgi:alcohol dehydrogenase class IV
MSLAALLSGIALANAGLGAVHAFAGPIGANFPVPHGVVCAALLPHVMSVNVEALQRESPRHPALGRYADIGRALAGRLPPSDLVAIGAGIQFIEDLVTRLNIPPLRQFGLARRDIPEMAALARRTSSMKYNPVSLSVDALTESLGRAI